MEKKDLSFKERVLLFGFRVLITVLSVLAGLVGVAFAPMLTMYYQFNPRVYHKREEDLYRLYNDVGYDDYIDGYGLTGRKSTFWSVYDLLVKTIKYLWSDKIFED